jgi:hypothetical protein
MPIRGPRNRQEMPGRSAQQCCVAGLPVRATPPIHPSKHATFLHYTPSVQTESVPAFLTCSQMLRLLPRSHSGRIGHADRDEGRLPPSQADGHALAMTASFRGRALEARVSGCEESCTRCWAALRRPAHPDDDPAGAAADGDGGGGGGVCAGESPLSRLVTDALRFEMQAAARLPHLRVRAAFRPRSLARPRPTRRPASPACRLSPRRPKSRSRAGPVRVGRWVGGKAGRRAILHPRRHCESSPPAFRRRRILTGSPGHAAARPPRPAPYPAPLPASRRPSPADLQPPPLLLRSSSR